MADDNDLNRKKLPGAKDQGDGSDGKHSSSAPPAKAKFTAKNDDSDDGWGRERSGNTPVHKTKGSWKFSRRILAAPPPPELAPDEQLYYIDRSGSSKRGREEAEDKQAKVGKDSDHKKRD